jgi:hypothetical protein
MTTEGSDPEADFDATELLNNLEYVIARTVHMTPRARVLTTLVRMVQAYDHMVEARNGPAAGVRMIAIILEIRDMARAEQAYVDGLFRDDTPPEAVANALRFVKGQFAIIEAATMNAIAYIGSDRQESQEATWWATWAGEAVGLACAHVIDVALELPETVDPLPPA